MNLDRFKSILRGYLDGQLSANEKEHVDSWFDSISNEDISPFKDVDHKSRIKEEILSSIPDHIYRKERPLIIKRSLFISIAASIVLICTIGMLFSDRIHLSFSGAPDGPVLSFEHVSTKAGEIKEYILPDRSTIWLSGNARIRFHQQGYAKNRKIYLDQGEAFFDVQQDPLHPFAIEVGSLSIQVLGTSFNVNNSKQDNQVTIDVKTGKVKVSDQHNKSQYILTKGKSLQYDIRESIVQLFDSDPANANLWTKGGMFLNDATFSELQELMYNRYGVSLQSDRLQTETFRYSILMPTVRSVDDLLNMICTIHQINYRRENDEIILYK